MGPASIYVEDESVCGDGNGSRIAVASGMTNMGYLLARLQALDHALNTLPQQARRMAREIAKRARARALPIPADKPLLGHWVDPPIRMGKPPGHRDRPRHDVDYVLKECHGLMKDIEASPP